MPIAVSPTRRSGTGLTDARPRRTVVSFIETSGRTREVEAIARRLKHLILHEGRRPGDIAIITRRGDPYAELIARVFPRYGLPLGAVSATALARLSLPRWLLALLRLRLGRRAHRRLRLLLRLGRLRLLGFDLLKCLVAGTQDIHRIVELL